MVGRCTRFLGLALVFVMAPGCDDESRLRDDAASEDDAGIDAPRCAYDEQCGCDWDNPLACLGGQCVALCAGVDGGTPCNWCFAHIGDPECCRPDEHCCEVGFEHEACLPQSSECPHYCPRDYDGVCPDGTWCLVEYQESDEIPPAGTCEQHSGDGESPECVSECPREAICSDFSCCGRYTRCEEHCCVAAPPDAGTGDAGAEDASSVEAGTADAPT